MTERGRQGDRERAREIERDRETERLGEQAFALSRQIRKVIFANTTKNSKYNTYHST